MSKAQRAQEISNKIDGMKVAPHVREWVNGIPFNVIADILGECETSSDVYEVYEAYNEEVEA